jgi:hypothetical protein
MKLRICSHFPSPIKEILERHLRTYTTSGVDRVAAENIVSRVQQLYARLSGIRIDTESYESNSLNYTC